MQTRPCWVEIDTRRLEDNYQLLRSLAPAGAECLAIVKANAYGHGLAVCVRAAVHAGAGWLGVTSVEEGLEARSACPGARVLVMGGVFPGQQEAAVRAGLTAVVWTEEQLERLAQAARLVNAGPIAVHLEIDTGMSRQGCATDELAAALRHFGAGSPLRLEAVMTHLYASDETDGAATARQVERLGEALEVLHRALPSDAARPQWVSAGASAALLGDDAAQLAAVAQAHGMQLMMRLGLALYGIAPEFAPERSTLNQPRALMIARRDLRPVLTWKTRVASLRTVLPGTHVGYNGTFVATEAMRLALIPAGYADGLDRRLGNRFSLLVRGQRAPLAGRISMDQAVLDVTEIEDVAVGDEVTILGEQAGAAVTVFDHAACAGTIPWEVFTRIGARVPRIAV